MIKSCMILRTTVIVCICGTMEVGRARVLQEWGLAVAVQQRAALFAKQHTKAQQGC